MSHHSKIIMTQEGAYAGWKRDLSRKASDLIFRLNREVEQKTKRHGYQWLMNLESSQQDLIGVALFGTSRYYNYYHYFNPYGLESKQYTQFLSSAAKEVISAFCSATYHSECVPKPFPKEWDYPGSWSQARINKQKELDEAKAKINHQLNQVRLQKESLQKQIVAFKKDIGIA